MNFEEGLQVGMQLRLMMAALGARKAGVQAGKIAMQKGSGVTVSEQDAIEFMAGILDTVYPDMQHVVIVRARK